MDNITKLLIYSGILLLMGTGAGYIFARYTAFRPVQMLLIFLITGLVMPFASYYYDGKWPDVISTFAPYIIMGGASALTALYIRRRKK